MELPVGGRVCVPPSGAQLVVWMGGWKMGIEPISYAILASMLINTLPRVPDVTTVHMPTCLCDSLPERSVQTTIVVLLVL